MQTQRYYYVTTPTGEKRIRADRMDKGVANEHKPTTFHIGDTLVAEIDEDILAWKFEDEPPIKYAGVSTHGDR